ncbi:MAG: hypothetical protein Q8P13_02880 [bacterium]|nr:hypothetical protein [bacterium]
MLTHQKEKGLGLIGIIILLALIFAALNVYSYYNPSFSLSKYSLFNFIRAKKDETRKNDLKRLQEALQRYYDKNGNTYPGTIGVCGRIVSVLHSEVITVLKPYFPENEFPADPSFSGTYKDYFYTKLPNEGYALMAVLEIPPTIAADEKDRYNFVRCYDWPGNGVYNYRLDNPQ